MRLKFLFRDPAVQTRKSRSGFVRNAVFTPKWVVLPHVRFEYGPEDLRDGEHRYTFSLSQYDGGLNKRALKQIDTAFSAFARAYYSQYGESCEYSYNPYTGLLQVDGYFHSVYIYEPTFSKTEFACRFEWASVSLSLSPLFIEPVHELTISSYHVVFSPTFLRAVVPCATPFMTPRGRYAITDRLLQAAS